jgi:hypothetical protein
VQRDDVGTREQLLQRHVRGQRPDIIVGVWIVGQQSAAEAGHDPREDLPDAARAHDADRARVEIEPEQAFQREVAVPDTPVRARDVPDRGQDLRDGVLPDRMGRIGGHAAHDDAEVGRGGQVDVVEAGRGQRHEADATSCRRREGRRIEGVMDEGADGREAVRERRRLDG